MSITRKGTYTIHATLNLPYDEAVERTRLALKEQGFGVLTEIDVKKTLKEKLGVDFYQYIILGACNPQLAHKAFEVETEIGAILPCNVIVYEENGGSVVAAMDPEAALGIVGNAALSSIAEEAAARLKRAIDTVAASS